MNFHVNVMEKIVVELHVMLKTVDDSIKKNLNHVMMIQKEKKKRKRWMPPKDKGKEKVSGESSSSKVKKKGKSGSSPNEECLYCHKKGHRFRNCMKYLEEQNKKKGSGTSTSGINVIESNIVVSSSDSCVFDIRSMIHTCKSLQGLNLTRRFTNPTFIWHCHLSHINEKRIERLYKDGLLRSFDFESFDTCESYLLGKMTKAPFTDQSERASDLLGLVNTDVCKSMSFVAIGGFQYFITFTDDFSRYGYIYLMRHKSKSFDKFKEI
jgi:hypothetical protein